MDTIFKGGCHCGRIKYSVEGELTGAMTCNCSMCQRKGILMWFVPRDKLQLLTPSHEMSTYTFNKHLIKHHFCPTCGIHPFGEAIDQAGNAMAAVNLRCIENFDLASVSIHHHDGRSQ